MERGDRGLDRIGARAARRERALRERDAFRDLRAIPSRAVLILQHDHVTRRVDPRGATGVVQQHQREQRGRLTHVGQEPREQAPRRIASPVSSWRTRASPDVAA
jgi:hypothetical protein